MPEQRRQGRIDASVLDHAQVAIIVTDLHGKIVDCNRHAECLYGLPREHLVGAESAAFALDTVGPDLVEEIARAMLAGETWEGDFRVRRSDGAVLEVHAVDSPLFDSAGRLDGIVSISMDVTDRRRAERRLAAQHAATRVLAGAATLEEATTRILPVVCEALGWEHGAFWELEPGAVTLRCVEAWRAPGAPSAFEDLSRAFRFRPGVGLPGRVWSRGAPAWIPDVVRDDNFPRAAAAAEAGLHGAFGVPVTGYGGGLLGVLEFFGTAVEEPDPALLAMMESVGSQVGQFVQRRRAEEAVRASEARKAAVLEAALDAVVSIDHDGRVTEFNPAAERIFGWPAVDVVGRRMVDVIVPPSLRDAHRLGFARYLETGEGRILGRRVELSGLRRDGREFPVELTVTRIDAPGPPAFTAFLRDITARRAAERDLRESRERLARLAWTLIESLLPGELPLVPGVELGAAYRPGGEGERVGGDFYDAFECAPGEWAVVVGDVCGKGPEAAALTALARYTTQAAALQSERPSAVLAVVNDAVLRHQPERFCTAVYARVRRHDGGVRVALATAGHPLPLHVPGSAPVRPVGGHGRVLGVTRECVVADVTVDLAPGDALVLYTDGVTDARRGDERFGDERLRALLEAARGLDAVALARLVERVVLEFRGGEPQDDVAVVVVRASPSAG